MKRKSVVILIVALCALLFGCSPKTTRTQIVATTLPVYDFTSKLCSGTDLHIARLVTENISCLHDYTAQVSQMQILENAEVLIMSGAGLEDFLNDISTKTLNIIDASSGVDLISASNEHANGHNHDHIDPHYWLSPDCARRMCQNIYNALVEIYPEYTSVFQKNYSILEMQLIDLADYAEENLKNLSCRKIITFHDGFQYMADAFHLEIAHAMEEESGREASAAELIELIQLVDELKLPALFTEKNGSTSAASIIALETGIPIYSLDMIMSSDDYFSAMYHNIDTIKEALG